MEDRFAGFWEELQKALAAYWQGFIHSLPRLGLAILVFLLFALLVNRLMQAAYKRLSGQTADPLFSRFIGRIIKLAVYLVGLMLCLRIVGLTGVAGGLLAGAGVSAFIIGFAFKDIAENFLAGIILAFNRPFALNDAIGVNEYTGKVEALNFRTTHMKTFDEKDVFIPNSIVLKETVTNLTRDGLLRLDFVVGIAYEDSIPDAIGLIVKTVAAQPDVLPDKEPFAVAEELATNTVNLRVFFWVASDDYRKGVLITKSNVVAAVKSALADGGFTLPANILELKMYDKRNALPLELKHSREQG